MLKTKRILREKINTRTELGWVGCSKKKGGCGAYLVRDCFDKNVAIDAWNHRTK